MTPATGQHYEDDALLSAYLLFHFGTRADLLAGSPAANRVPPEAFDFPSHTVEFFRNAVGLEPGGRALDVGCAVGRSTFEMVSRLGVVEAIGIDFSASFVEAANQLQRGDSLSLRRASENHLGESVTVSAPMATGAASFEVGDAMALREDLGAFDFVHAANLLCRLPEPAKFLKRVPDLVKPGGFLVIATPCTWMETFTPIENQPPGATLEFIAEHLEAHFERLAVEEIPFAIREHARKVQISTAQTSLWQRR
jgi:putative 4-mercaptohistidine N1-methyltranferase